MRRYELQFWSSWDSFTRPLWPEGHWREEQKLTWWPASSSIVKGIGSSIVYVTKRKLRLPCGPFEWQMPDSFCLYMWLFMQYWRDFLLEADIFTYVVGIYIYLKWCIECPVNLKCLEWWAIDLFEGCIENIKIAGFFFNHTMMHFFLKLQFFSCETKT